MTHDAIDFVIHYDSMLDQLKNQLDPKFHPVWLRFKYLDPHDLVSPEMTFGSFNSMIHHLAMLIWVEYIDHGHSLEN
jgi:hypothetical protein